MVLPHPPHSMVHSPCYVGLATALGLQSNITNILRECVPGGSGSLVKGMGSAGSTFQTSFGDIVSATQAASSVSTYSLS
jgi:hypothetical protein